MNKTLYKTLKPQNWLNLIFVIFFTLIARLPLSIQIKLGRGLGKIMYYFASRRKKIAKINLKLCFPEKTQAEHKALLKENFALNGLALIEAIACWHSNLDSRLKNTTILGQKNLEKALKAKKGVILLSYHLTSLEVGGSLIGHHYPVFAMYKTNKSEFLENMICSGRLRHVKGLIKQTNMRGIVKTLKQNGIVWYASDQNHGSKAPLFVPFFGIQATALNSTSKLTKMTGATVLPFTQKRSADGKSIELTIHPALENIPSRNDFDDALKINQFLENYLTKYPADYMWLHQRFRTRPKGEKSFYI